MELDTQKDTDWRRSEKKFRGYKGGRENKHDSSHYSSYASFARYDNKTRVNCIRLEVSSPKLHPRQRKLRWIPSRTATKIALTSHTESGFFNVLAPGFSISVFKTSIKLSRSVFEKIEQEKSLKVNSHAMFVFSVMHAKICSFKPFIINHDSFFPIHRKFPHIGNKAL